MMLTGKQLEQLCIQRMKGEEKLGRGKMERANIALAQILGHSEFIKDLVDFRGEAQGIPFKLEAKTCSTPSFELREAKLKRGQYEELKAFNGIGVLLIYFNPRRLLSDPETFAVRVTDNEVWRAYEAGEKKSLTISDCFQLGVPVEWNKLQGGRKNLPDIVGAIQTLIGK